jgi:hypothetical protein
LSGLRYRDLVEDIIAKFGAVSPVELRELAGLQYALEQTQADVVLGDARARDDLVRISNLVARRENELRAAMRASPPTKPATLEQHLARRSAERARTG